MLRTTHDIRSPLPAIDSTPVIARLIVAGGLGGLCAGLLLSLLQQVQILPLINEAERYEAAAAHSASAPEDQRLESRAVWIPQDGGERLAYTVLANTAMAIGFGLVMVAGFALVSPRTLGQSLSWGMAGYLVFFLAPALHLPPELPGTYAHALETRQLEWLIIVICSALGLAGLVFGKGLSTKLIGAAILMAPHLYATPLGVANHGVAPDALATAFLFATSWVNLVFWLTLGLFTAFTFRAVGPPGH